MKKLIMTLSAFATLAIVGMFSQGSAQAATACTLDIVDGPSNNGIKVSQNGKNVYSRVIIKGDASCTKSFTLATWKLPNAQGLPLTDQEFYNYSTATRGPGTYRISAPIPECYWQADLLAGSNPKSANGDANYQLPRDILANYKLGGDKSCTGPTQNPVDPTCQMTITPTTLPAGGGTVTINWTSTHNQSANITGIGAVGKSGSSTRNVTSSTSYVGTFTNTKFTPAKSVTCNVSVTVAGTPPPPPPTPTPNTSVPTVPSTTGKGVTSIPSTGAGSVIAGTLGLSTSTGLAYNLILKRKLLRLL